nr:10665_t:CDS:2 [Entrophospora candida]
MKKKESNDLLQQIIHQKITGVNNKLEGNTLYLYSESISASELGEILGEQTNKIVKKSKIDFSEVVQDYLKKVGDGSQLVERPPIVSIMGHIDHGKTTLFDTIRQTTLQKKEAGGITQKMRQKGINLTDLVVLVIDAQEGVMPQTEEIINYLCQYELPVIVFINHKRPAETDNEKNLNRIRSQCQQTGLNPFDLQDPTHGTVIDAYLHPQTGSRVTELLIQGGKLQEKDTIFLNGKLEKAKTFLDTHSGKITTALPGDIIKVIGLTSTAEIGDRFLVIKNEEAKEKIKKELTNYSEKNDKLPISLLDKEKKKVNLVLISDSQNKLNALSELIKKKNTDSFEFSIVNATIGNLNNFVLNLIKITQSTILVFGPSPSHGQIKTFKENNIPFFNSAIIYEIEEELDKIIGNQQLVEEVEEIAGQARVIKVFFFSKGNIAGCKVVNGKISRNHRVHVYRGKEEKIIFSGEIKSLESQSEKKTEVISGQECGIVLKGFDNFQTGDKIVAFKLVKKNVSQN